MDRLKRLQNYTKTDVHRLVIAKWRIAQLLNYTVAEVQDRMYVLEERSNQKPLQTRLEPAIL